MALALAFFLPMLALAIDQGLTVALVQWVCATGATKTLIIVPGMSLLLILTGTALGGTVVVSLHGANPEGGQPRDPRYFVALMAIALNVLVALLIVTAIVPRQMLSPCE
jgi:hypothetical protein